MNAVMCARHVKFSGSAVQAFGDGVIPTHLGIHNLSTVNNTIFAD